MRVLVRWMVRLVVLLAVLAAVALGSLYFVPQVQDAVFDRMVAAGIGLQREDLLKDDAMRAVVCGSSSPMPDPNRAKACIAVFAGGKVYFVDTGPQSAGRVTLLKLPVAHIGGVLFTHFHSDHIADLGEFNMNSWVLGRKAPLDVYGPPGVERVVAGFAEAYTLDQGYRTAHHGAALVDPEVWKMVAHPVAMPGEPSEAQDRSAVVLDDGKLKITAFEVHHNPVTPAYGYRFDYGGRSIVITGDTAKHAPIVAAAKDADVLFHEAQGQEMVARMQAAAGASGNKRLEKLFGDIQTYHASPIDAADTANKAGVKLLVFYHYTPPMLNFVAERMFLRGLSAVRSEGSLMSRDGTLVELPLDDKSVVRHRQL